MKIATHLPIINDHQAIVLKISSFWNKISPGWREIWGPHIHHGFYENSKSISPLLAQEKLIEKLAAYLDIQPSQRILDVGCGMGGSSLYLAKHFGIESIGITLSQQQLNIAKNEAKNYPELKINYQIQDAHDLSSFPENSFDVVWSLESCEQFYNKQLFFEQVNQVLKPGGKFMLATWCSDQEYYENVEAKKYLNICKAFDLPYMPTLPHYLQLLQKNFIVNSLFDWTSQVKKSWSLGIQEIKKHSLLKVFKLTGFKGLWFLRNIKLINEAFNHGRMIYGVFILTKPL